MHAAPGDAARTPRAGGDHHRENLGRGGYRTPGITLSASIHPYIMLARQQQVVYVYFCTSRQDKELEIWAECLNCHSSLLQH